MQRFVITKALMSPSQTFKSQIQNLIPISKPFVKCKKVFVELLIILSIDVYLLSMQG